MTEQLILENLPEDMVAGLIIQVQNERTENISNAEEISTRIEIYRYEIFVNYNLLFYCLDIFWTARRPPAEGRA